MDTFAYTSPTVWIFKSGEVISTCWESQWSWEESGGDNSLQKTLLMDFSCPHHLHKDFRQKKSCVFDVILNFWVYNSTFSACSMCCAQATPSLCWRRRCPLFFCDAISAVPTIARGRMPTLAFTLQTAFYMEKDETWQSRWLGALGSQPLSKLWSARRIKHFTSRQRWRCFIPRTTTWLSFIK